MERLDFTEASKYNPIEASIHLNRYLTAKQYVAGKRVLDIACGEGYGSKLMKDWGAASVVGVDVSDEALAVANRYFSADGITFLNHTAEELPFDNDSFDVVVSFETIEHLDHPEKFLQEIARVVKFDGVALVSCPNDPYYSKNDPAFSNPFHKHAFNFFEFKELSERYLGREASWYFGFGLGGFSTIPMKDIRLPEGEEGLPANMLSLFSYECGNVTASVPAGNYLNYWNANYYLGIWGYNAEKMEERAVLYPKEFFAEDDSPIWTDITLWKKEFERQRRDSVRTQALDREQADQLAACQAENAELKRRLHISQINNERTSNLLKLAEEEKRLIWQRIDAQQAQIRELSGELDGLRNSKAVKLVFLFWRIRDKIFGRKK